LWLSVEEGAQPNGTRSVEHT
jgi:hypothetical protein